MASTLIADVAKVAMAIIGVALIALLLNRNAETTNVIEELGRSLSKLLKTVTLQA